tara:strand:+ start:187 stop:780 length:594 start_codon:yes stop_codon:yes gene_type:complete
MITPKIVSEPKWKSYIVKSLTPIFTPYECKEIIEIGNKLPQLDANIGLGKTSQDHSKRKTDIAWIPFDKMPDKYEILDDWGMKINNNHFGFDPLQIGEMAQFTKYSKEHHYDWHTDSAILFDVQPPVRKLTMVTMLSDPKDFTGGELQIIDDTKENTLSLKQGEAIFFASFIRHRVLAITSGIRISMPIWFGGTPLR